MNRLLKVTMSMLLVVATLCFIGCNKADDPYNGGNGNNNGNSGETPEIPAIVSTSEIQYGGTIIIEAVFDDESKMYFKVVSPTEVALVSGEFYYFDNPSMAYLYRGEVVIPESITHFGTTYSVVSIAMKAFYHNAMVTSVYIPNSVTKIESIKQTVEHIGKVYFGAFQSCSNLNSIRMSDNIQEFGIKAFHGCPCYQESVIIPKFVKSIGVNAFDSESVFFYADSCATAGGIENEFFCSAFPNMKSICFGDNVYVLPEFLCAYTNITMAEVPSSVSRIGYAAYYCCRSLTDISLPSSICQINDYAFYLDENIADEITTNIICRAVNPPVLGYNVFGARSIQSIQVPMSSVEAYKTANGWSQYANVIVGI